MSSVRRGGIPGPESRTGLVRPPAMTEAEFERQQATPPGVSGGEEYDPPARAAAAPAASTPSTRGGRSARGKAAKPRRVQRMFAIEEDLDKKLWLYAIHLGKDRSDVVNDVLRPVVASMVLYDSRDRRTSRAAAEPETASDGAEGQGG